MSLKPEKPQRKSILVVDDTIENIQVLGNILEEKNYTVYVAHDGRQCLDIVDGSVHDLILLDIMMPGLDGYEVCRQLKERSDVRHIPVIFLTARVEKDDVVKGFELGAVDYVTKPFNPAELLRRVETHIQLKDKTESLVRSNRNFSELLHILCHDLANPFTALNSYLEMSAENPDMFEDILPRLQSISDSVSQIISTVKQMRELDEGRHQLKIESCNLAAMADESLEILATRIREKNITVHSEINDDLCVNVERNTFIHSVLNNILTNAVKFSFENAEISITAKSRADRVILQISDHGIGMRQSLLDGLFDITTVKTRPGTAGEKGTGFGMQLMKKFVDLFSGQIKITSVEKTGDDSQHGTTVELNLVAA